MRLHWRCSLVCLVLVDASDVELSSSGDAEFEGRPRSLAMSRQGQDESERQVQIGPHGSMVRVGASLAADARGLITPRQHRPVARSDALLERAVVSSANPRINGYKKDDCSDDKIGQYELPNGANMLDPKHCLAVKCGKDGAKKEGRMTIKCAGDGGASVCIYFNGNDTSCSTSEPWCLKIKPIHTDLASAGHCVAATQLPGEKTTYVKFEGFKTDTKWPDCLSPALGTADVIVFILMGVMTGNILLCGLWFCVFAEKSPKQAPHDPYAGGGKGWGDGEGKGKGNGKGWGGGEEQPGHASGELDASGNALPASIPGVPNLLPPPGDPHMMKGKGMDPNMNKGAGDPGKGKGYGGGEGYGGRGYGGGGGEGYGGGEGKGYGGGGYGVYGSKM